MAIDTLELTRALLRCPSVTPDEAGALKIVRTALKDMGFKLHDYSVHGIRNLWAKRGSGKVVLTFAGHLDVVPAGDVSLWKYPPFAATCTEGRLYGRGAVDMKSSIAAMLSALAKAISKNRHLPTLGFLLTCDEEGVARYGTRYVVESLQEIGEKLYYCLVGEPTSECRLGDHIKHGRRGSLSCTCTMVGKQGHVAYPHLARNPLHAALPFLQALLDTSWDNGSTDFDPTQLQIVAVDCPNNADNIIPRQITWRMNWRYSAALRAEDIQARTADLWRQHRLEGKCEWRSSAQPFLNQRGNFASLLSSAIQQVTGIAPRFSTGGGTSDARFLAPYATEVLELGPLHTTAHQIDEYISLTDLLQLQQIYHRLLCDLATIVD